MIKKFLLTLGPLTEDQLKAAFQHVDVGTLHGIEVYTENPKPKAKQPTGITRMHITDDVKRNMRGLKTSGYDPKQIAELVGCSVATVKRHVFPEMPV